MYRHTVTIYDKNGNLLAKIPDRIDLKAFGFAEYSGDTYLGGPVEAAFSNKGKTLWVSNYNMIGEGFDNPGCDGCNGKGYDPGFVYKINTTTFQIEKVIKVGAVPKYLAISRDEQVMVVSNWSSGDVSIIDLVTETEIKKVDVGAHPRGVAISSDSKVAYVTVMGSTKIASIDLQTYAVSYIEQIGKSPRHVVLSANDSLLYVSLNSGNCLVKYDLKSGEKQSCTTNAGPRSMVLSPDQHYLYVVNYFANTFSKINTDSMKVMEVVATGHHPIGITVNWEDAEVWVACYEGKIEIFKDFHLAESMNRETYIFEDELAVFLSLFQPKFSSGQTGALIENPAGDGHSTSTAIVTADDEKETIPVVTTATVDFKPRAGTSSLSKIDPSKFPSKKTPDTPVVPEKTADADCEYHVIVGSFSVYENAVNFKSTVQKKGYQATLIESSKGLTYVSAACFLSREAADGALTGIYNDLDVKGWVLHQ